MDHLVAFSLWPITVYWYGVMYFIGFLVWYVCLWYGWKSWRYTWTDADIVIKKDLDWLILAVLLGVMVGGRLGDVLIYNFDYFVDNPGKIVAVRDGGMSFIGWIVGVVISVILYINFFSPLKKNIKKDFFSLFDALIPLVPVGIFFGRIGNFLNQELYGIVVPSSRWLSQSVVDFMTKIGLFHNYAMIDNLLRVNTNVLSMLFEWLFIALILWILFFKKVVTKKWNSWQLSFVFLTCYSFVRFFLEYLRQDSQGEFLGIFTRSQWFFFLFFIVAIVWFILRRRGTSRIS